MPTRSVPKRDGLVGIYCRISRDPDGTKLGVNRQEKDCRELCDQRGWTIGEVFIDDDVSAYSLRKPRPAYTRMLDAVREGRIGSIVAWHPDRLHRHPMELEEFIVLIEETGTAVHTVTAGKVDLSTSEGRFLARVTGSVARKESEDKSRRLQRKHRELAEAGKVSGRGNRPFGFSDDWITHNPSEAALVQEAAERVLAGESLASIRNDWRARNVPTSTGAQWSTTAIKTFLTSPRIAGFRSRYGEIVADAVWEPILDEVTWRRTRALLDERTRKRVRPPRSYLLSGLIWCGRCGERIHSSPRAKARAYSCLAPRGGCGGCSTLADSLEELIVEATFLRLDGPELAEAVQERRSVAAAGDSLEPLQELAQIEAQLEDLAALYGDGDITMAEWKKARGRLTDRLEKVESVLVVDSTAEAVDHLAGTGGELREAWPLMEFGQRRAVIEAAVERVVLNELKGPRNRFDPDRVEVIWRA